MYKYICINPKCPSYNMVFELYDEDFYACPKCGLQMGIFDILFEKDGEWIPSREIDVLPG